MLDGFIVAGCGIAAAIPIGIVAALADAEFSTGFAVGYYIVGFIAGWLYPALMESSDRQATIGKRALGIFVTDTSGRRISFARATGRLFAKFLNSVTFGVGWLMAGFTAEKRGLHDYVAGTLVLSREDARKMNGAVIAVIWLAGAIPIVGIIAAIAVPGLLRARMSGNEASAIGAIRAINAAQVTYAASCGGGGYAQTIADLAKAPIAGGEPFLEPALVSGQHNGYYVTVEYGSDSVEVLRGADTCNGSDNNSRSAYFAHAEPIQLGSTGLRSFATNETGIIYENPTGSPITNTLAGGKILQ